MFEKWLVVSVSLNSVIVLTNTVNHNAHVEKLSQMKQEILLIGQFTIDIQRHMMKCKLLKLFFILLSLSPIFKTNKFVLLSSNWSFGICVYISFSCYSTQMNVAEICSDSVTIPTNYLIWVNSQLK